MSDDYKDDKKNSGHADADSGRRWEDLIFGTIEKLAQAPNRLKDSKETVGFAFDWVKGMRQEIQEKVREEISSRIGKLDFNQIAKKLGDHLANNYKLKVNATVQWVPKENQKKSESDTEAVEDLDISFERDLQSDASGKDSEFRAP